MIHKTFSATLTIVDKHMGLAKFDASTRVPEEMGAKKGTWISKSFTSHDEGSKVHATWRLSSKGAHLIDVRAADESGPESEPLSPGTPPAEDEWFGSEKTFYISPEDLSALVTADKIALEYGFCNVGLLGVSGSGKTTLPEVFAYETGREFVVVECPLVQDPEEWFGYRQAEDGSTIFDETNLVAVLERGNAVVLFNEINRIESWKAGSIYALLDDTRATTVLNRRIKVGENTVFFVTANEGYEYVGTFPIDKAFRNRVQLWIRLKEKTESVEREILLRNTSIADLDANVIVNVMARLRASSTTDDIDLSTRASLYVAHAVSCGMSVRDAFEAVIVRSSVQTNGIVSSLNALLGPLQNLTSPPRLTRFESFKEEPMRFVVRIKDPVYSPANAKELCSILTALNADSAVSFLKGEFDLVLTQDDLAAIENLFPVEFKAVV